MKKMTAVLLAALMLVSITACGSKEAQPTESQSPVESDTVETTPSAPVDGTALTTEFWSLTYPADWELGEDDLSESEGSYASVTLSIPDPDSDYALVSVYIEASVEEPDEFRDLIKESGMDAYDLIENDNAEYTTVGGV